MSLLLILPLLTLILSPLLTFFCQLSEQMAAPRLFRFIIMSLQVVSCFSALCVHAVSISALMPCFHMKTATQTHVNFESGSSIFNSLCRAHRNIKLVSLLKSECVHAEREMMKNRFGYQIQYVVPFMLLLPWRKSHLFSCNI